MGRGRRVLVAALKLTRWLERSSAMALDYDLPPRLITTSTLLPRGSTAPSFGFCPITRPLIVLE
jgi:hypothetical protein